LIRDFSSERPLGLIKDVLGSNLNLSVPKMLLHDKKVDSRRSNDNFHIRVEFCVIDCVNETFGALEQAICLNCKLLQKIEEIGEILILKFYKHDALVHWGDTRDRETYTTHKELSRHD
jgi:hypothetical protein